jgi:hypothetical protein
MNSERTLRRAIMGAVLLVVLVSTAQAHNVVIWIAQGKAGADGNISFKFTTDEKGTTSLHGLPLAVKSGEKSSTVASNLTNFVNSNKSLMGAYTAASGTKTAGGDTYETVTITPVAGVGSDFDTGNTIPAPDPLLPGISIQVVASIPGTTSLQLTETSVPDPSQVIDWTLLVEKQSNSVDASVFLAGVPDTTSATSLIAMFDSALLSQGIPVVANGDTLSLRTSDNDFFVVAESVGGSLYPSVSDSVAPEPTTVMLFGSGMLALFFGARRR